MLKACYSWLDGCCLDETTWGLCLRRRGQSVRVPSSQRGLQSRPRSCAQRGPSGACPELSNRSGRAARPGHAPPQTPAPHLFAAMFLAVLRPSGPTRICSEQQVHRGVLLALRCPTAGGAVGETAGTLRGDMRCTMLQLGPRPLLTTVLNETYPL